MCEFQNMYHIYVRGTASSDSRDARICDIIPVYDGELPQGLVKDEPGRKGTTTMQPTWKIKGTHTKSLAEVARWGVFNSSMSTTDEKVGQRRSATPKILQKYCKFEKILETRGDA